MSQLSRVCRLGGLFNRSLIRYSSSKAETEPKEDDTPVVLVEDPEDLAARQKHIEKLRRKGGLAKAHRRILNNKLPYTDPESWVHETLRYQRTMFGRYGLASGVDPRICYPTEAEKADRAEYEKVAYPHTLQEMMAINEKAKREKADAIRLREEHIEKKMGKLDGWVKDLNMRVAKKEKDAREAKERKDRIVEEVRRHFGYTLDTRDEKFQELLAQKEKEEKKAAKEAKRKNKEMKMLEKLVAKGKASEAAATTEPSPTPEKS